MKLNALVLTIADSSQLTVISARVSRKFDFKLCEALILNIGESLSKYWQYIDTLTGQKPAIGGQKGWFRHFTPVAAMAATIALGLLSQELRN